VLVAMGVDLGTTLRGGEAGVDCEVTTRFAVEEGAMGLVVPEEEAAAIRAFEAAVGADSLLADADPPVCCGFKGAGAAAGGATEGREDFAAPGAVAFERVDGRDEDEALAVLDGPEVLALERAGETTLDLAGGDVPELETGFVPFVDFSGGGLEVVGSLGAVACSG